MKKTILTLVAISAMGAGANAATLLAWNFTGSAGSQATNIANSIDATLDGSDGNLDTLTRGAGAPGNAAANSFRTTNFKNDGISITNTDYFQFAISSTTGYSLSLSTIDGKFGGTSTYSTAGTPSQVQFAYSLDGTNFTLIGSAASFTNNTLANAGASWDLTGISALQNLNASTTVTFRMYATGATTTGGYGLYNTSGNGLDLIGTTTAVPEPAAVALIGLGMGGALWGLRRRRAANLAK